MESAARLSDFVGLTPEEQELRKRFLEFTDEDARILAELRPWLQGEVDSIVAEFYEHLVKFPPLRAMLVNPDVLARLQKLQRQYFIELIDGKYGPEYVENRLRVGQAHERVGLDPKWYLGAYNRYFRLAIRRIAKAHAGDAPRQLRAIEALCKILFFDIGLAIDTYIAKAQQDLQRRAEEMAAINDIARAANASLDLMNTLNTGLDRSLSALRSEIGMLLLIDPTERELLLKAHRGLPPAFLEASARIPVGTPIAGQVAAAGVPVVADDLATWAGHGIEGIVREGVRSAICVPLRARGRVVGVMNLFDRRRARFAPSDLRFLTSIADTLGIAIDNARLYTETSQVAAVGEMAASIAHEIKNPLAGISCALQVLGETSPPDDARRPVIDEVLAQVRRLDQTVRELLVFARPTAPRPVAIALSDVVERVHSHVQGQPSFARIRITTELVAGADRVMADPELLRDVLLNLFLNAADAMPEGGALEVRSRREGDLVAVAVTDSGTGMPQHVVERLFRPFFTTKTRGTGLGLSICKKIIESHGGRITVASQDGKGTTVTVLLPPA